MDNDTFERQLRLIVLLVQNRTRSIDDISRELQLDRRSVYRYIERFRRMGFAVIKEGHCYRLDHQSPFFTAITDRIHFTDDEAMTLSQVLDSVPDHSPQVRHLRGKLATLYDSRVLARHGVDDRVAKNISTLFEAIRQERIAVLRGYTSPSSGVTSDRVVEPYLFLSGNSEVRCYELSSGMNKTFKVSRAESVELVDLLWTHREEHAPFFTDLFHFSGEERLPVHLEMGALATSLLLEEFPAAEGQVTALPDGRHRLDTEVCSLKGVTRFVLGLMDDIRVVDSPQLEAYLRERVEALCHRCCRE